MNPELAAILLQICKNTLALVDQVEIESEKTGRHLLRTPLENSLFESANQFRNFIKDNNL